MLLVPVAQVDNQTVRRHPWVSYWLVGANFLVALVAVFAFDQPGLTAQVDRLVRHAQRLLAERPYLSISPQLAEHLSSESLAQFAELRGRFESEGALPDPEVTTREQAELNALTDDLLAAIDALPAHRLGYIPARREILKIFTSLFVHSGWIHLLGNMLFLFLTAPFIEDRYGRPIFLALYLLSGVAATNAHTLSAPESLAPLVGASGAIAGVMGAFLVRLGAARIRLLFLPIPIIPAIRIPIVMPAFVLLPLWLGEQFVYARAAAAESDTAWWAHVGGFLFGATVALAIRLMQIEETWINAAVERETTLTQHSSLELACEARTAGDFATAKREIRRALAAQPESLDAWAEGYDLALATENGPEVARAMSRLLELYAQADERGLAVRLVHDPRWAKVAGLPPQHYLRIADLHEQEGDRRRALELYQQVVERTPADLAALRALVRRGEILLESGNPRAAREAYAAARAHPECTGRWPELVDRALARLPPPPPVAPALEDDADVYILGPTLPEESGRDRK